MHIQRVFFGRRNSPSTQLRFLLDVACFAKVEKVFPNGKVIYRRDFCELDVFVK